MIPVILVEFLAEARTILSLVRTGELTLAEGIKAGAVIATEQISARSIATMIIRKYQKSNKATRSPKEVVDSEDSFFFLATRAFFKVLSAQSPSPILSNEVIDRLTLSALLSPTFANASAAPSHKATAFIAALNQEVLDLSADRLTNISNALDRHVDGEVNLNFISEYLSNQNDSTSLITSLDKLGFPDTPLKVLFEELAKNVPITAGLKDIMEQFASGRKIHKPDTWMGLMRGAIIQLNNLDPIVKIKEHKGHIGFNVGSLLTPDAHHFLTNRYRQTHPISITSVHVLKQEYITLKTRGWSNPKEGSEIKIAKALVAPDDDSPLSHFSGLNMSSRELINYAEKLWNGEIIQWTNP